MMRRVSTTSKGTFRYRGISPLIINAPSRPAAPLFVGTIVPPTASLRRPSSVMGRLYSSRSQAGAQKGTAKRSAWTALSSVLLASAAGGIMMTLSGRKVHAQESTENVEKPAEKTSQQNDVTDDKNDFVSYLLERPILLLLLDREDVDDELDEQLEKIIVDEDLKAMHLLDYQFFSEDKSKFPSNAVAVVYNYNSDTKQMESYIYPADRKLTPENIKQFLEDLKEHKLDDLRFHPSEGRPENDSHAEVKNLKVVTRGSFKELVLDSDNDVLVYINLPSRSVPTDLQILASALGGEKDLVIAQCNSFMNELDPTYFGDTPIEGIKLFRKGKQSEPVTYHGKGDLLDVVAFVAQQRGGNGEDIYHSLRKADKMRLLRTFEKSLGNYYMHTLAYKEFVSTSHKAKELFQKLFDMYDQLNANDDPFKQSAEEVKKQLKEELKKLELAGLKRIRMIEKDQYKEELEEARKKGKVVVFFWRRGCWPCKKINPMLGKISEDFPEVTFLKVDADAEGLNATPTFYIYEDEKPRQLSGVKLVSLFHTLAKERGLPGYADWLPPSERSKLPPVEENKVEQEATEHSETHEPAAASKDDQHSSSDEAASPRQEEEQKSEQH